MEQIVDQMKYMNDRLMVIMIVLILMLAFKKMH